MQEKQEQKRPLPEQQTQEGGGQQQQQQGKQQRKRQKKVTPETALRWEIHQAAKANDPLAALAAYDRGTAEGALPGCTLQAADMQGVKLFDKKTCVLCQNAVWYPDSPSDAVKAPLVCRTGEAQERM